MPEKNLYEYATLRYVPRVERGEFINVGLAMMCKRRRWIRVRLHVDEDRLRAFAPGAAVSPEQLRRQLASFEAIAAGDPSAGPVAAYPVEERFRWLTAEKSACVQTSRPHPGLAADLDRTFDTIFAEQVLL